MSYHTLLLATIGVQSIALLFMGIIVRRLVGDISSTVRRSETVLEFANHKLDDLLMKKMS